MLKMYLKTLFTYFCIQNNFWTKIEIYTTILRILNTNLCYRDF